MPTALTSRGTPQWVHSATGVLAPVFPSGYTLHTNDIALLLTNCSTNGATIAVPAGGWAKTPKSPGNYQAAFWKYVAPGDTLPGLTWAGGGTSDAICIILAGDVVLDPASIFENDNFRVSTSTAVVPFPNLTIGTPNCYVLQFGMRRKTGTADGAAYTAATGFTNIVPASVPNGSDVLGTVSFQQQTTATSIGLTGGSILPADVSSTCQGYILAIRTAAAPSAGFTAGPAINSTTAIPAGSYTLGFTPNAAGTFYAVALLPGSPQPTPTQMEAGKDSFGNAAQAAVSKAVAGANTAVLGGALTGPLYDVYCVFRTTVDSAVVALTGRFLLPTSGEQFVAVSGPPDAGVDSILQGAVPAAAAGDVMEVDLATSGGFPLFMSATGVADYVGDGTRQQFTARVYQLSSNTWSARTTFSVNNSPPLFVGGLGPLAYALNALLTPQPLAGMWQSTNPDPITVTATSGLPPGIFVSNSALVGAGTVAGIYVVSLKGADSTGDFANGTLTVIVGPVQIPRPLKGLLEQPAEFALGAVFFVPNPVLVPADGPSGIVLDSTPPEGTFAPALSVVTLSISAPLPGGGGSGGGGSGGGGGTTPPPPTNTPTPPIQSPGSIVARDAGVQLVLSDLFHYWGNDLSQSNTQDLLTVSGTLMGQQRVLRRLLTNPGDYRFDSAYGAGLPAFVGSTTDAAKITALIRAEILKEAAVAADPAPVITLTTGQDPSALLVQIQYYDAPSGVSQTLSFTLSK